MVDLNTLIPPNSSLELTFAYAINDPGEIVGTGLPSGCTADQIDFCGHAYALIPCDEHHPGIEGCDYSMVDVPRRCASDESPSSQRSQPRVAAITDAPDESVSLARFCIRPKELASSTKN